MNVEAATTKSAKVAKKTSDILFRDESYRIMGACFAVYKEMGNGFLEAVYQESLAMEFSNQAIPFEEKPLLKLEYKGQPLHQTYQPDFLCFNKILVEIKAAKQLANDHRSQTINYLKATGHTLALLVNFGHHPQLEYERFLNTSFSSISCISQ